METWIDGLVAGWCALSVIALLVWSPPYLPWALMTLLGLAGLVVLELSRGRHP